MSAEQTQAALSAIQALIAHARFRACDEGVEQLADLLDGMELLPVFVAENRIADFDEMIRGIVTKHPDCRYVLEQYADHPLAVG